MFVPRGQRSPTPRRQDPAVAGAVRAAVRDLGPQLPVHRGRRPRLRADPGRVRPRAVRRGRAAARRRAPARAAAARAAAVGAPRRGGCPPERRAVHAVRLRRDARLVRPGRHLERDDAAARGPRRDGDAARGAAGPPPADRAGDRLRGRDGGARRLARSRRRAGDRQPALPGGRGVVRARLPLRPPAPGRTARVGARHLDGAAVLRHGRAGRPAASPAGGPPACRSRPR